MKKKYKMLIVDDEELNLKKLRRTFSGDFILFEAHSGFEGYEILKREKIDIIISDQKMPDMMGIELLKKSIKINPDIIRIVLTGYTDTEDLIDAINLGRVHRYITKPWSPGELKIVVRQCIEMLELQLENKMLTEKLKVLNEKLRGENLILKKEVDKILNPSEIVFKSDRMKEVIEIANSILDVDTTVLITGETGTGKELLARYIHLKGKRKSGLFVPVNCGAIPSELIESELFGYKRGAFSGANRDKKGFFQLADGGTLFLDEIGEAPLNFQTKLLRVLQDGVIWPVGAERGISVDVRVIAATNRDLKALVEAGKFREDLWYRLNVFNINVPPLRERKEDIEELFYFFLKLTSEKFNRKISGVEDGVIKLLKNYHWPGNIRQLQNEVERIVLLTKNGEKISPDILSREIVKDTSEVNFSYREGGLKEKVSKFEKELVEKALILSKGNRTKAAKLLKITRQSLIEKIKRYKINL